MGKLRVLLTGGSGMVGKNFLDYATDECWEVLSPVRKELDLCDYSSTLAYLQTCRPDIILHAAGKVGGIHANLREPMNFLLENLDMGRNLVWAARQAGVRRFLNLGSSCMYPRNHEEPLCEAQVLAGELEPTNEGYALAKIVTSRLCTYISREDDDYQYKTLIPCNLYGRYDKFNPTDSHLIPAIIHKVHEAKKSGTKTVEIWGDGMARREFMYAGDLAHALVRAVKQFDTLPALMNIGLGFDYTINQYYEAVAQIINYEGQFTHDLSKPVGMARKLVNVDRMINWGWQPRYSLHEGIAMTYSYYRKVHNL